MGGIISEPRFSCGISAQQTVLAIPRAIPIVHAGPGCSAKTCLFMTGSAGSQGDGYAGGNNIPSTNMSEQNVVFGGETKLTELVNSTLDVMDGDLFVIMSGCTSGIIGDDVKHVASLFSENGLPVVGAETSGFRGTTYTGHEEVISSIIDQFVGDVEPHVRKGTVNVFASVPCQDPFWRRDLEDLKSLLTKIGLKVNILFGWDSAGVSEWRDIPNAQANIVVSPWVGVSIAKKLEAKYGTPYLHYPVFPVGARATSDFLRAVGRFCELPQAQVEAVIAREEKRYYDYFISFANFLADMFNTLPRQAYVVADSHYGLGVADFLANDMSIEVKHVILDDEPSDEARLLVESNLPAVGADVARVVDFEADGYKIDEALRADITEKGTSIILGSTWETDVAKDTDSVMVHLSIPIDDDVVINRGFFGYDGGLRLIEEIYAGVYRRGNISTLTKHFKE